METLVGVFTVTIQDDRILIPSHGLIDGDVVKFRLDDPMSCVLPFPLNDADNYHVVGARGNDFQVSATPGGPLINLTDKGTGSNEVWEQLPDEPPASIIRYTGKGDFSSINLQLFGDGVTKDLSIDLSKPPFNLNFLGFYPKHIVIANASPAMDKTITMNGNNLLVYFEEPPPAVDFSNQVMVDAPENRITFTVYFVYGAGASK